MREYFRPVLPEQRSPTRARRLVAGIAIITSLVACTSSDEAPPPTTPPQTILETTSTLIPDDVPVEPTPIVESASLPSVIDLVEGLQVESAPSPKPTQPASPLPDLGGCPDLMLGDTDTYPAPSTCVRDLETLLNAALVPTGREPLVVDGVFDEATTDAVKTFSEGCGIGHIQPEIAGRLVRRYLVNRQECPASGSGAAVEPTSDEGLRNLDPQTKYNQALIIANAACPSKSLTTGHGYDTELHYGTLGYLGWTDIIRRKIQIDVRDRHRPSDIAFTLLHEAMHARFYTLPSEEREKVKTAWLEALGLPSTAPFYDGDNLETSPVEALSEMVAIALLGLPSYIERISNSGYPSSAKVNYYVSLATRLLELLDTARYLSGCFVLAS